MTAAVDGVYDVTMKTPLGDQSGAFTVVSSGDSFHGTISGALGSIDVKDGKVDGNRLIWRMDITMPMPMSLGCEALVEGDRISASINTGAFGTMVMSGTRRS